MHEKDVIASAQKGTQAEENRVAATAPDIFVSLGAALLSDRWIDRNPPKPITIGRASSK
ncbi:hypothetical protein [Xanthomonas oryzae]|uniref:hypothetical protein n=1 Tax=Xanthomonas oryzae TaxID=347 RepID=UPI0012B1A682|nr:hypothetical protein [Xanthomonas oryzae]MEC5078813.1 hypothetical protein [Xanthomonas oryzae pv. oryzicola]MEC5114263.1 hypothetical protein [Xanthomonas oryzae pv. oryzicola]